MSHDLIGRRVEIRPAFNSETGERDIWDDIAGCEATVRALRDDGYAVLDIKGRGEDVVAWGRVKLIGASHD